MIESQHSTEEWRWLRDSWSRSFSNVIEDLTMAKKRFKPKTIERKRLQLSIAATMRHRETVLEVIDVLRGVELERE